MALAICKFSLVAADAKLVEDNPLAVGGTIDKCSDITSSIHIDLSAYALQ